MAYKVIILYQLYMPSYFLGTFTEYPKHRSANLSSMKKINAHLLQNACRITE